MIEKTCKAIEKKLAGDEKNCKVIEKKFAGNGKNCKLIEKRMKIRLKKRKSAADGCWTFLFLQPFVLFLLLSVVILWLLYYGSCFICILY